MNRHNRNGGLLDFSREAGGSAMNRPKNGRKDTGMEIIIGGRSRHDSATRQKIFSSLAGNRLSLGGVSGGEVCPERRSPTAMYTVKSNTPVSDFQKYLAAMWKNEIGTDAVLYCQDTRLPVHKIILMAASPYVTSVIEMMGSAAAHMMPVIAVDIPPEAGKALLTLVYFGETQVLGSIYLQVLAGAKFLGISGIESPRVLESISNVIPAEPERTSLPSPSQRRADSRFPNRFESSSQLGNMHQMSGQIRKNSVKNRSICGAARAPVRRIPVNSFHPVNLSRSRNNRNSNEDEMYEADGCDAENMNLAVVDLKSNGNHYSPAHSENDSSDDNLYIEEVEQFGDDAEEYEYDFDGGQIPAQLLNPNVEYHIGKAFLTTQSNEFDQKDPLKISRTYGVVGGESCRGRIVGGELSRNPLPQVQAPPAQIKSKTKKSLQPNICKICSKTFSNAYNLRVHMDAHSDRVFPCCSCTHTSPSRDALRKHFTYRHRELWRSGKSPFRGNDTAGRKYSESQNPEPYNITKKMDQDLQNISDKFHQY